MEKSHQLAIQQALDYIRANLSEDLSVSRIAEHVGYSPVYLRSVFRKATGKGVLPHIIEMRIDKARTLLCNTRMSMNEIAFAIGFEGYKHFHKMFVKRTGCSPSEFRKSQGIANKAVSTKVFGQGESQSPWYYESFQRVDWSQDFKAESGNWSQEREFVTGADQELGFLTFGHPLPENFHLSFEARLAPEPELTSAEINLQLRDFKTGAIYCHLSLGRYGGAFSELRPRGFGSQINQQAVPLQNRWNQIEMNLNDDTVVLSMNGTEAFVYKDAFPLPVAQRSRFAVAAYNGRIQIRKFEIHDLGFLVLVRNVRAGDALYNAGFFSAARDYYVRLLASKVSTVDSMELRYKIGRCFLSEGNTLQARNWLEKVIFLPETGFWAQQAALCFLEVNLRDKNSQAIPGQLRILFENPVQRNGAREIIDQTCNQLSFHGFLQNALVLRSTISELEKSEIVPAATAEANRAEALFALRRYAESEHHFRKALAFPKLLAAQAIDIMFPLFNALALQGKLEEGAETIKTIETASKRHPLILCRLDILKAFYFRAKSDFDNSLRLLLGIHKNYPRVIHWRVIGNLYAAFLHLMLGRSEAARDLLRESREIDPKHPYLNIGQYAWCHYPVELCEGNLENAVEFLRDDLEANPENIQGAEFGLKAGIIQYLTGNVDRAAETWTTVADNYLAARFNYLGHFADALAGGKMLDVDPMPLTGDRFSEMLYLLGLLCEKWGKTENGRELFKRCVAEDPLLGWPAFFSKKKLDEEF